MLKLCRCIIWAYYIYSLKAINRDLLKKSLKRNWIDYYNFLWPQSHGKGKLESPFLNIETPCPYQTEQHFYFLFGMKVEIDAYKCVILLMAKSSAQIRPAPPQWLDDWSSHHLPGLSAVWNWIQGKRRPQDGDLEADHCILLGRKMLSVTPFGKRSLKPKQTHSDFATEEVHGSSPGRSVK